MPAAAHRLAAAYEASSPLLESAVVVLPVGRANRRLRELLLEEADQRSIRIPPPRTVTVGAVPEMLYQPALPPGSDLVLRRLWADALRAVDRDLLQAVFPQLPNDDDLTGWHNLARIVGQVHQQTGREGLTFADVAEVCEGRFGRQEADRWHALAGVQDAYRDRLQEFGLSDRQFERKRALEEGRVRADERTEGIWLVGVVELPSLTRRMLVSLDVPVRALVHAPDSYREWFDELGLVRPERWADEEIDIPEVTVCSRPPEQAESALRALSGDDEPLAPDAVTIGVPNDDVVPHLEQRLEQLDVPHRYAAGEGLPQTRPYRLLEAVADYLDGHRFADLASLVRHPDLSPLGEVPVDAVDLYFTSHLPRSARDLPLTSSAQAGELRRLIRFLTEGIGLRDLEGRRPLNRWMPAVLSVLERVYGDLEFDASRPSDRRLLEACAEIGRAAEAVARIPAPASPECSAVAAIRILLAELRDSAIPPEPERPAVEMLGWLELHLDDAPVLVLTGMNDEAVPGSAGGDPFLPDSLRAELGLPDDRFRHGRDAYLLAASLHPRAEAHMLVGRRSRDGDPLRPSRLLLSVSAEELAHRVRHLFRERDRRPAVGGPTAGSEQTDGDFTSPPEPVIRADEVPTRLRVTDFEDLLQDPYRFALVRLRRLKEMNDSDRELGGGAFGEVAHEILHRFGDGAEAGSPDVEQIEDRLQVLVDEVAVRRYGQETFPAVRLQVAQLRYRLRAFARWHARRVASGWRVVTVEASPEEDGVPFDVDDEPILLRGRIDRIDRHDERDEWQLLDYKTGESPDSPDKAHRKGRPGNKRWVSLQLPLYRHLLPGIAQREGVPSALGRLERTPGLGYVQLSGDGVELSLAEWSDEELHEADEAARDAVRTLRRGEFRYRPGERRTFRNDPLDVLFEAEQVGPATEAGEGEA